MLYSKVDQNYAAVIRRSVRTGLLAQQLKPDICYDDVMQLVFDVRENLPRLR